MTAIHPTTPSAGLNALERAGVLPPGTKDGRRGTYTWEAVPFRFALSGEIDRSKRDRLLWQVFVRPQGVFGEPLGSGGMGGLIALRATDVPAEGLSVSQIGEFAARGAAFFDGLADFSRVLCSIDDVVRDGVTTRLSPGLGARTVVALALARSIDDAGLIAEIEAFLKSDARVVMGPDTTQDLLTNARRWAKEISKRSGIAIPLP